MTIRELLRTVKRQGDSIARLEAEVKALRNPVPGALVPPLPGVRVVHHNHYARPMSTAMSPHFNQLGGYWPMGGGAQQ